MYKLFRMTNRVFCGTSGIASAAFQTDIGCSLGPWGSILALGLEIYAVYQLELQSGLSKGISACFDRKYKQGLNLKSLFDCIFFLRACLVDVSQFYLFYSITAVHLYWQNRPNAAPPHSISPKSVDWFIYWRKTTGFRWRAKWAILSTSRPLDG